MTELQLIKTKIKQKFNKIKLFNTIAKIAVILHHETAIETQSQIVYRLLIQYFEEDLKNSKGYLYQQAKFLLERRLTKINNKFNLDEYSFEEIIEIINSYQNKTNFDSIDEYKKFWEELSWLGYSSSGSILKRNLRAGRCKNKLKWIMNSSNSKKNKKTNAENHYNKYHPGARLFLFSFVSMLDRCKTDLKLDNIKNSCLPIYDIFTINDINNIRLNLQEVTHLSNILSQKMLLNKSKTKILMSLIIDITKMNKLLPTCNNNCCRGWHDKTLHIDLEFFNYYIMDESFSSTSTADYSSDEDKIKLPKFMELEETTPNLIKRALSTPSPKPMKKTQDIIFLWNEMNNSLSFNILYDNFIKQSLYLSYSIFNESIYSILTENQLNNLISKFGNSINLFDQMRKRKRIFQIFQILKKSNVSDISSYFEYIKDRPNLKLINQLINKHGSGIDIFFNIYVKWFMLEKRKICRKNRTISCPDLRRIYSITPDSSPGFSPEESPLLSPLRAPSCPPQEFYDFVL